MNDISDNITIGVLGGGQLGQMLIRSAIDFNIKIAVLDPDPQAPCSLKADYFVVGDYNSSNDIVSFAQNVDILTIEIENVNVEALEMLESMGKCVYPQSRVLKIIKNKSNQKKFYEQHKIPTAPFTLVAKREEAEEFLVKQYNKAINSKTSLPQYINKVAIGGYDGRGVKKINAIDDFNDLFDAPGILEECIKIKKEISIIVARNKSGEIKCYPATELHFNSEANLVDYLTAPANIPEEVLNKATEIAKKLIITLDMVGILAVEMFLDQNNNLLVNEVAPRTHNSGHHTIEGNVTSQFEQHIRAILDLPLGDTSTSSPVGMVNILGEECFVGQAKYFRFNEVMAMKGAHIHLYGKKRTNPFRKMGHITIVEEDIDKRKEKLDWVRKNFKVVS